MQRILRENAYEYEMVAKEPKLKVRLGEKFLCETEDALNGMITREEIEETLGTTIAVAADIEPEAVGIARQRMQDVRLFIGSAAAIRSASADVVVANIDAATIERIAPELARVRKPASTLILSGFPEGDVPDGFHAKETLGLDGWVCLIC